MIGLGIVVGVVVIIVLAAIFRTTSRTTTRHSTRYNQLLRRVMGDVMQAERLIELERGKQPKAGREQLIHAALNRLKRDTH